jgi:hypothetical protein
MEILDECRNVLIYIMRMAGLSMKDLASKAEWLERSWAVGRLGACLGRKSQRDVIG